MQVNYVQYKALAVDGQGIQCCWLAKAGRKSWAFWQGFRAPKGARTIEWPVLPEADRKELENRIVPLIGYDVINAPEELAQNNSHNESFTRTVGAQDISYRIKGDDLLGTRLYRYSYGWSWFKSSTCIFAGLLTQEPTQMLLYLLR